MHDTFFQSVLFEKFQEKIPYRGKTWRLSDGSLVILAKMRFGFSWLWLPYALPPGSRAFAELAEIAKKERAVFARIEPGFADANLSAGRLGTAEVCTDRCKTPCSVHRVNFLPGEKIHGEYLAANSHAQICPAPSRFTPEHTLVLDLEKTEDEILAQMKPKGRYNINVALRRGIVVEQETLKQVQGDKFDQFYNILKKTAARDGFGIHPQFFYEKLLETFGPENSALFLARSPVVASVVPYPPASPTGRKAGRKQSRLDCFVGHRPPRNDRQVVAGIIVVFYKDTATYYYGASSHEYRNLMAPYLLQWEAICEARRRGMKHYDFLGIAPPDSLQAHGNKFQATGKKHLYTGITEFKKKFGGREVSFPPAFDVVYKPLWYSLLKIARRI